MSPARYRVYGLRLQSAVPIDGLDVAPIPDDETDVELMEGNVEFPADAVALDATPYADDEPGIRIARRGETYFFGFADGTRFRIEDRTITASWTSTREDMSTYLLGPILAFVLRLRGTVALHASAVAIDGRALLLSGPPGAGKSTTATAFVSRGATMLTDDVAAIEWREGVPHVLPGYARLRLWDDSAAALFGSAEALEKLTPTWEKRFVDARASFAASATPIAALVLLAGRHDGPTRLRALHGHEALMATLVRTSLTHLLDAARRRDELDQVARLVEAVPVYEAVVHADLGGIEALVEALRAAVV